MKLTISPFAITRLLAIAAVCLATLGGASMWLYETIDKAAHRGAAELLRKFLLDGELTVPAWFTAALSLSSASLLGVIALANRSRGGKFVRHWAALAVVFVLMSIDEMAGLHEMFIVPLQRRLGVCGVFHYAWVIPGLVFVAAMGAAYFRFVLFHLPSATRRLFLLAGAIYVGGALGMEMAEGVIDTRWGADSPAGLGAVLVEESMEMMGLIVFLFGLMRHIEVYVGDVRIGFGMSDQGDPSAYDASDEPLRALRACVQQELVLSEERGR